MMMGAAAEVGQQSNASSGAKENINLANKGGGMPRAAAPGKVIKRIIK
jgi:hypothetical protein